MVSTRPLVLTLSGEYDLARTAELDRSLEATHDAPVVILDMSAVSYMDSSCLGALVRMRMKRREKSFPPAGMVISTQSLRRLFKITNLDEVWPIYETLEEALQHQALDQLDC